MGYGSFQVWRELRKVRKHLRRIEAKQDLLLDKFASEEELGKLAKKIDESADALNKAADDAAKEP